MKKYTKIGTLFNRDTEGTKKLIPWDYENPAVEFLAKNQWICTEKIDGTNIGVVWDGYNISFQGRTENANIPKHLLAYLEDKFLNDETEQLFEQKFGEKNVILFGEGYGPKILKGHLYREDVSFILFDVYMTDSDLWLKRDAVEDIGKVFDIDVVPIILTGTLYKAIEYVINSPKSTIGTAPMEGLVCKPTIDLLDRCGKRIIVKVKVKDLVPIKDDLINVCQMYNNSFCTDKT